jgi:hypothetical protein
MKGELKEINVGYGSSFTERVSVTSSMLPCAFSWQFLIEYKDIGFSAIFIPTAGENKELQAYQRIPADALCHAGSAVLTVPGTVVLCFDNTFSMWTNKQVWFRCDQRAHMELMPDHEA